MVLELGGFVVSGPGIWNLADSLVLESLRSLLQTICFWCFGRIWQTSLRYRKVCGICFMSRVLFCRIRRELWNSQASVPFADLLTFWCPVLVHFSQIPRFNSPGRSNALEESTSTCARRAGRSWKCRSRSSRHGCLPTTDLSRGPEVPFFTVPFWVGRVPLLKTTRKKRVPLF